MADQAADWPAVRTPVERPVEHPCARAIDRNGKSAKASSMAERWLTYQQAGDELGMTAEAVRHRSRRLGWRTQPGNNGRTLVLLPEDMAVRPPVRTAVQTPVQSGEANNLADLLREQLERERERADKAESRTEKAEERAETAEGWAKVLAGELAQERERAARAEGEAGALRHALAREVRQLEQTEAALKTAETQRDAAQSARGAVAAELAVWAAGGPLARAWRAFLYRRRP